MKQFRLVKFNPKRTFGIEMEWSDNNLSREGMKSLIERTFPGERAICTSYQRNSDNNLWFCKRDSSCGLELATRVLGSLSSVQKTLDDLRLASEVHKLCYQHGARVNQSCGGHVHLGFGDCSELEVDKFLLYWVKFEKFIMDMMPRRRMNNSYCCTHSGFFTAGRTYDQQELRRFFGGRSAVNLGHYVANHPEPSTRVIEIRLAEGSDDYRDVKNWVRFLLYFIDKAKALPVPENVNWVTLEEGLQILDLMNQPDKEEFLILSPALLELREWILNRTAAYAKFRDARTLRERARNYRVNWYPTPSEHEIAPEAVRS